MITDEMRSKALENIVRSETNRQWENQTLPRRLQESHAERCEEQGHDWENCCSVMFQVYQRCKWCGERR